MDPDGFSCSSLAKIAQAFGVKISGRLTILLQTWSESPMDIIRLSMLRVSVTCSVVSCLQSSRSSLGLQMTDTVFLLKQVGQPSNEDLEFNFDMKSIRSYRTRSSYKPQHLALMYIFMRQANSWSREPRW